MLRIANSNKTQVGNLLPAISPSISLKKTHETSLQNLLKTFFFFSFFLINTELAKNIKLEH
jgi:hypothetical protein